jgi:uncharacterized protein DUF4352
MRLKFLLIAPLLALVFLAVACGGGGSSGGGGSDEEQAGAAAKQDILKFLGLFDGSTAGKDLLAAYAPECRQGVKASDVDAALALIRAFVPDLSKSKVEDVDLGKLSYEKTSDGIKVSAIDPNAVRLKVKGKWMTPDEYFSLSGLTNSSDATAGVDQPTLMVKRDGKWYIGDCSSLKDFSNPLGGLSDSTPTASASTPRSGSQATPAVTAGPGRSRSNPVKLGQSGRVEDTWELTVLSVNRDAWTVIQAANRFNDPPAANEKMLMIKVRAKNIATKQQPENIDDFSFRLVGSRNQLYDAFSSKTQCGTLPDGLDANLFPAGQAEGNICFKVPSDETGFVLVWEGFGSNDLTYFALE